MYTVRYNLHRHNKPSSQACAALDQTVVDRRGSSSYSSSIVLDMPSHWRRSVLCVAIVEKCTGE